MVDTSSTPDENDSNDVTVMVYDESGFQYLVHGTPDELSARFESRAGEHHSIGDASGERGSWRTHSRHS